MPMDAIERAMRGLPPPRRKGRDAIDNALLEHELGIPPATHEKSERMQAYEARLEQGRSVRERIKAIRAKRTKGP